MAIERELSQEEKDLYTRRIMKVTERYSLLYTREWIAKAVEDGKINYIRVRRTTRSFSIGQLIALRYYQAELIEKQPLTKRLSRSLF